MKNNWRFIAVTFVLFTALFAGSAFTSRPAQDPTIPADIQALLNKYGCAACHSAQMKLVGPKWGDIAAKKYPKKRIVELVYKPEPGNWPGYPAMAAQTTVPKADLNKIAGWIVSIK